MRIASVTMVGQFPHGIPLHVRNLLWALGPDDHIYIVTLPRFIEELQLKNTDRVTYIPFLQPVEGAFINFWNEFPNIVRKNQIKPEWFLFMEEDIWFFAKPELPPADPKTILSMLSGGSKYRNVMVGDKLLHNRVSECGQCVHGDVVRGAIDFGINFSFVANTFLDRNRTKYEEKFGGPIGMSMYQKPDTMDEFGLYCALEAGTHLVYDTKATHLRGPETLHRMYPELYTQQPASRVLEVQKKISYFDVLLALVPYYVVGLWPSVSHLDWTRARNESKVEVARLLRRGGEWLDFHQYTRLDTVRILMGGNHEQVQSR
jgi:hypothetical protein